MPEVKRTTSNVECNRAGKPASGALKQGGDINKLQDRVTSNDSQSRYERKKGGKEGLEGK